MDVKCEAHSKHSESGPVIMSVSHSLTSIPECESLLPRTKDCTRSRITVKAIAPLAFREDVLSVFSSETLVLALVAKL